MKHSRPSTLKLAGALTAYAFVSKDEPLRAKASFPPSARALLGTSRAARSERHAATQHLEQAIVELDELLKAGLDPRKNHTANPHGLKR